MEGRIWLQCGVGVCKDTSTVHDRYRDRIVTMLLSVMWVSLHSRSFKSI